MGSLKTFAAFSLHIFHCHPPASTTPPETAALAVCSNTSQTARGGPPSPFPPRGRLPSARSNPGIIFFNLCIFFLPLSPRESLLPFPHICQWERPAALNVARPCASVSLPSAVKPCVGRAACGPESTPSHACPHSMRPLFFPTKINRQSQLRTPVMAALTSAFGEAWKATTSVQGMTRNTVPSSPGHNPVFE
eukprot:GGOE01047802.1.p3 GENE.GGOE01047802.1~~GGOE01047802.1.p3  ORF type:complete len:192 (-),score=11.93 GGOE01047802.1:123-698(-)